LVGVGIWLGIRFGCFLYGEVGFSGEGCHERRYKCSDDMGDGKGKCGGWRRLFCCGDFASKKRVKRSGGEKWVPKFQIGVLNIAGGRIDLLFYLYGN